MSQQSNYHLDFQTRQLPDGRAEALCAVEQTADGQYAGDYLSHWLATVLNLFVSHYSVDDILWDIDFGMSHPQFLEDSYIFSGVCNIAIFDHKLFFGFGSSPEENDSILLTDAKALFLEWKTFLEQHAGRLSRRSKASIPYVQIAAETERYLTQRYGLEFVEQPSPDGQRRIRIPKTSSQLLTELLNVHDDPKKITERILPLIEAARKNAPPTQQDLDFGWSPVRCTCEGSESCLSDAMSSTTSQLYISLPLLDLRDIFLLWRKFVLTA